MPSTTATTFVRRHAGAADRARDDRETLRRVQRYAVRDARDLDRRIDHLQGEWDQNRVLDVQAAVLGLAGVVLASRDRRWLALPGLALGYLLLHAVSGSSPLGNALRRLGVRRPREIEEERFALKALRGDFQAVRPGAAAHAWRAARR